MEFTTEVRNQLDGFRDFVQEAEPRLYAKGQERLAVELRDGRPPPP